MTLKTRKLLIPLNEKNAKNTGFAQVRYTSGTRGNSTAEEATGPRMSHLIVFTESGADLAELFIAFVPYIHSERLTIHL